mgnify:CR=1 FL=1
MTALLIPLMTSVVVRSYGWMILLASTGVVNMLLAAGPPRPPRAAPVHALGVVIALAEVLLPFMVLSLLPVLQGVDRALEEASQSLGARSGRHLSPHHSCRSHGRGCLGVTSSCSSSPWAPCDAAAGGGGRRATSSPCSFTSKR